MFPDSRNHKKLLNFMTTNVYCIFKLLTFKYGHISQDERLQQQRRQQQQQLLLQQQQQQQQQQNRKQVQFQTEESLITIGDSSNLSSEEVIVWSDILAVRNKGTELTAVAVAVFSRALND
jgi:hypothetical protein